LPHVQPTPDAVTYVNPAGKVSTSVSVPLVASDPVSLGVSVYVLCKPA
jgi:hypothetical protein